MGTPGSIRSPSVAITALAALLVAAGTFVVFSPGLKADFIGWDDNFYIAENPFIAPLALPTVGAMFSRFYFKSYTPLTLLSHAIDYRLFGLDPRGHHLVNILIHAANAVWVFLLAMGLFRTVGRHRAAGGEGGYAPAGGLILCGAAVAALCFAWHPLRVESVACASSRKDLLSGFFALPSLLAYLQFAVLRGDPRARRWYLLSLALFLLALLSKGSVMVLPGVLFLVDFMVEGGLPREPGRLWRLIKEKAPFLLLALAGAIVAYKASEMEVPNQAVRAQIHEFRPLMVLYNFGFYTFKTFWPFDLVAIYDQPSWRSIAVLGTIPVVLTAAAVILYRRGRFALPLAWGSYLMMIAPMSGIVPASIQLLANRYAYAATLGFALLAGWIFVACWSKSDRPVVRPVTLVLTAAVLFSLAAVTARSLGIWRNAEAVWTSTLRVSPRSPLAHSQMGFALEETGDYPGALAHFYSALEFYPDYPEGLCNLGGLLILTGDTVNAEWALSRAVTLTPESHFVYTNLGNLRIVEIRVPEAITLYRRALALKPDDYVSMYDLGYALMTDGKYEESAAALRRTLQLNPTYRDGWYLLGVVLGRHLNDREGGVSALRTAARLGHLEARRALLGMGVEW